MTILTLSPSNNTEEWTITKAFISNLEINSMNFYGLTRLRLLCSRDTIET